MPPADTLIPPDVERDAILQAFADLYPEHKGVRVLGAHVHSVSPKDQVHVTGVDQVRDHAVRLELLPSAQEVAEELEARAKALRSAAGKKTPTKGASPDAAPAGPA